MSVMEFKELLLLKKLSFGILSLTGSLVLILGAVIAINMSSSNPYKGQVATAEVASNRGPASVPSVTLSAPQPRSALARYKTEARILDVDCGGRTVTEVVPANVAHLRIRGRGCGASVTDTEMVNASNGYVATLFQTNREQISSDYIQLNSGENRITIRFRDRLGAHRTSELLISRKTAP